MVPGQWKNPYVGSRGNLVGRHGATTGWVSSLGMSHLGVHRAIVAPSSPEEAIWELTNQRQIE